MMDHARINYQSALESIKNTRAFESTTRTTETPRFQGRVTQPASDQFQPRFQGTLDVETKPTITGSRWQNERVPVNGGSLLNDLLVRLDEIMTTSGEAYAVRPERKVEGKRSEAFTTLFQVNFYPEAQTKRAEGKTFISTTAQVETTDEANMGLYSEARSPGNQNLLASARANFMAIDAESFADPDRKLETVDVRSLEISAEAVNEQELNRQTSQQLKDLSSFYKPIGKRLGHPKVEHVDLRTQRSPIRLINDNDYVTPGQLNKKHSGHGGVTAGMAMDHMKELAARYLNESNVSHVGVDVHALTASFARPYFETDALQFDTTLDHVDEEGRMFLSTRVSRHDTQGGKIEGPVFMFHSMVTHKQPKGFQRAAFLLSETKVPPMDAYIPDDEGRQRQTEAKQWAELFLDDH